MTEPWTAKNCGDGKWHVSDHLGFGLIDEEGYFSKGTARIVSAAPELLDELIRAARDLESLGYSASSARDAIKKATGRKDG